jgi:hypothetical protein
VNDKVAFSIIGVVSVGVLVAGGMALAGGNDSHPAYDTPPVPTRAATASPTPSGGTSSTYEFTQPVDTGRVTLVALTRANLPRTYGTFAEDDIVKLAVNICGRLRAHVSLDDIVDSQGRAGIPAYDASVFAGYARGYCGD